MNQVNVIGNIGVEPEFITLKSGRKKVRFSIAINSYSKTDGQKKEPTWVACEAWEKTAERMLKCAEKGSLGGSRIQITGYLAFDRYERKVGNQAIMVNKLYVKVSQFTLLSKLQDNEQPVDDLDELPESQASEHEAA